MNCNCCAFPSKEGIFIGSYHAALNSYVKVFVCLRCFWDPYMFFVARTDPIHTISLGHFDRELKKLEIRCKRCKFKDTDPLTSSEKRWRCNACNTKAEKAAFSKEEIKQSLDVWYKRQSQLSFG